MNDARGAPKNGIALKRLALTAAAAFAAVPAVWLGRAALAHYADISICFSPLQIVSYQDRIDAAVRRAQDPNYLEGVRGNAGWLGPAGRAYGEAAYQHLLKLDPRTCCSVSRDAYVGEEGRITLETTLLHDMSHAVDMGVAKNPHTPHFYIPTDVCGLAVPYKP